MKLGYIDRVEKQIIHILPKHRREDLFDSSETTQDYATRFFKELRGLGNINIVKLQGSQQRIIGHRYL